MSSTIYNLHRLANLTTSELLARWLNYSPWLAQAAVAYAYGYVHFRRMLKVPKYWFDPGNRMSERTILSIYIKALIFLAVLAVPSTLP